MQGNHLANIDYGIMLVYLMGMVGIGLWFAKRQKSSEDFFVAGRTMGWFPLALSIWSSGLSGISLIGSAGYTYAHDLQFMPVQLIALAPILIFIYMILPVYFGLSLTTAYQYLERRYGLGVRVLGSTLFIITTFVWLAMMIYSTSLVLAAMTPFPLWGAVLLVGLLATAYTTLGGIMADIWSDVIQSFIMKGAVVLIWIYILRDVGGFSQMWQIGVSAGRTYPVSSGGELWSWISARPNFTVEVMFMWLLLSYGLGGVGGQASGQVTLQRCFSARTLGQITFGLWVAMLLGTIINPILDLTGTGLFAYFHTHGAQFVDLPTNADQMLPYFVAAVLPVGISGLFLAGIFAGTMSSADSAVNSLSAAMVTDFYRRLRGTDSSKQTRPVFDRLVAGGLAVIIAGMVVVAGALHIPGLLASRSGQTMGVGAVLTGGTIAILVVVGLVVGLIAYFKLILPRVQKFLAHISPQTAGEAHYLRISRSLTLISGVVGTLAAMFMERLGQIYIIGAKLSGFWGGPLSGIFLLALFTRRATSRGILIGALIGIVSGAIWAKLGYTPFMIGVTGMLVTLIIGYLISTATGPPTPEQLEGMTYFTRFPDKK